MISCDIHPDGQRVIVTFTVTDPERAEQRVHVVGDFNDWDPEATPLLTSAGTHAGSVALFPGRRYRFRYLSSHDGWFNDDTGWFEFNEFGQKNCVLDLVINLESLRRQVQSPEVVAG
jgi:1,4-alpha-glucan branching enzyme